MPACLSCSRHYRNLPGERCDPCVSLGPTEKPKQEWPACVDCSKQYDRLYSKQCGDCAAKDLASQAMPPPPMPPSAPLADKDPNQDIDYAMTNPANSRDHGRQNPYINPYHSRQPVQLDENDPRAQQARDTFQDFSNGYSTALQRANPNIKPSKPKYQGAAGTNRSAPQLQISVVVRRVINRNKKNLNTPFNVQLTTYPESTPWSNILNNTTRWLDGVYAREYGHRIRSSADFVLEYDHSKTVIDSIVITKPDATLCDLWDRSTEQPGVLVQAQHQKKYQLELAAIVDYPLKTRGRTAPRKLNVDKEDFDESEDNHETVPRGSKRRASGTANTEAILPPFKRSTGTYLTNIAAAAVPRDAKERDYFVVTRLDAKFNDDSTDIEWVESDPLTVFIEKKEFGSGKTKMAFRLNFKGSNVAYAAKEFFNVGSAAEVTSGQNLVHLKEELVRQLVIHKAVVSFKTAAAEMGVSVHELEIANAFILKEPLEINARAWLVDPLLDSTRMRKFSGTNTAGKNKDLAGKTCDAFAHFTLCDSDFDFVPVDLQGIVSMTFKGGMQVADSLILFDVMAHSKLKSMGLGDCGEHGIQLFRRQHNCNSICKELELPFLQSAGSDDSGDEVPENKEQKESEPL